MEEIIRAYYGAEKLKDVIKPIPLCCTKWRR